MEQDPERQLRGAVARVVSGKGTPEDEALIKFESVLKGGATKYQPDEFGNVRAVTEPTLYDRIYGASASMPYQPQYPAIEQPQAGAMSVPSGVQPLDTLEGKVPYAPAPMNKPLSVSDLKGVDFSALERAAMDNAARVNAPAPDMPSISPNNAMVASTPKGMMKAYETDEAIRQKALEADISASEAGAKKRSELTQESQVSAEQRQKALKEVQTNLQNLLSDAKGTPSGLIEGAAATVSNWAGVPNKAALKRARFESGKAISGLQSRISFLKGQGTITDAEAKQAMAFIPEPDDSYEIKIAKIQGGIDYINSIAENANQVQPLNNKPGFKYLGVE